MEGLCTRYVDVRALLLAWCFAKRGCTDSNAAPEKCAHRVLARRPRSPCTAHLYTPINLFPRYHAGPSTRLRHWGIDCLPGFVRPSIILISRSFAATTHKSWRCSGRTVPRRDAAHSNTITEPVAATHPGRNDQPPPAALGLKFLTSGLRRDWTLWLRYSAFAGLIAWDRFNRGAIEARVLWTRACLFTGWGLELPGWGVWGAGLTLSRCGENGVGGERNPGFGGTAG